MNKNTNIIRVGTVRAIPLKNIRQQPLLPVTH
ncbi:Uncharacterised protein [Sphingobacterium multivorum]|uniref:Uncharacterized protein n=1 Tax=Sphingobacterium multivorum TaxID=28454 RepID=A0A2X2JY66_SPHMU|nr:Uncharacterised protein [Sphingobacterium multivorum]